jgi:hypothetical protein
MDRGSLLEDRRGMDWLPACRVGMVLDLLLVGLVYRKALVGRLGQRV